MVPFDEPVYVTSPLLPPLEDYQRRLRAVWDSRWLTNDGAQCAALRDALCAYLRAEHLSLFCNGTAALSIAARALGLEGEVVTTPFTFAATPQAMSWIGLQPVFADIDPRRLTLSPEAADAAVTPRTSAILAVHVLGMPCDVHGLAEVARRRGLKLLYDGAHAFGLELDGQGIASFGDATMFSFHATKLFHTAEGGAVACRDAETAARLEALRNFQIMDEETVAGALGTNGKMTEVHAALGLSVLACLEGERSRRAGIEAIYREGLRGVPGIAPFDWPREISRPSLQYFAVRVDAAEYGMTRDALCEKLRAYNVFPRKYFHPLCSTFPGYRALPSAAAGHLPVATAVSAECMTLPFYGTLPESHAARIAGLIRGLR